MCAQLDGLGVHVRHMSVTQLSSAARLAAGRHGAQLDGLGVHVRRQLRIALRAELDCGDAQVGQHLLRRTCQSACMARCLDCQHLLRRALRSACTADQFRARSASLAVHTCTRAACSGTV